MGTDLLSCLVAVAYRDRIAYIVKNYCDVWDIKGTFFQKFGLLFNFNLNFKKNLISLSVSVNGVYVQTLHVEVFPNDHITSFE